MTFKTYISILNSLTCSLKKMLAFILTRSLTRTNEHNILTN